MRHGDAGFSNGVSDSERGLSVRGKEEIALSASELIKTGIFPSFMISSPVRRARETAALMMDCLYQKSPIHNRTDSMAWHYNSHPAAAALDLLAFDSDLMMVVSHQPLIGDLIWQWCRKRVPVPTGSIYIIDYLADRHSISGQIIHQIQTG